MSKKFEVPDCKQCGARLKSIFCGLEEEELSNLNVSKGCSNFKKGQSIFNEGGRPQGLFCVNSGKIKVFKLGDEGKEQIVRFAKEGDIMGYRALLSGDLYSCSATAIDDANICFIPKSLFFEMVGKNVNLSMEIMKLLSQDLKKAENKITELAQKPVRERLAEALLFIKETYGFEEDNQTLNVSLTREEIANIVGTATETVIRLLSDFKSDNIIELKGKSIKVLDMKRLIKIANIFD